MSEWSSGYVVDMPYTPGFYGELSPSFLAFCALVQGYAAPGSAEEPLTYCELACGQGRTTNILAAANPHVTFYANDFNPSHIAGARALAGAGGLSNVTFFEDSFEEFGERRDLPSFDIVALHGIYSWVSPQNRAFIQKFIKERLRPGGLVYISYNTMPGWAPLLPVRGLLTEWAAQGAGSYLNRLDGGIALLKRLEEAKARFFVNNPKAAKHLADIGKRNRNYLVHEYLNRDCNAFFFAEVARELAEAKLTFVASASATDGLPVLSLTAEQQKILAEIEVPDLRETVRDHLVDQSFRRDIFIKGPTPLTRQQVQARWLDCRFGLVSANRDGTTRKVRGPAAEVEIAEDVYTVLLDSMREGTKSLRELLAIDSLGRRGLAAVRQGLQLLIAQGTCRPGLPEAGLAARRAHVRSFNLAIADRAFDSDGTIHLASAALGSGVSVDRVSALVWLARQRGEADVSDAIVSTLDRNGQQLSRDGKALSHGEALAAAAEIVGAYDRGVGRLLDSLAVA